MMSKATGDGRFSHGPAGSTTELQELLSSNFSYEEDDGEEGGGDAEEDLEADKEQLPPHRGPPPLQAPAPRSPLEALSPRRSPSVLVSDWMSLTSAGLYGSVGLCMGFANKAVLMQWPHSNALLLLQNVAAILIVYALKALGLISVRPFELRAARALAGVVFFYNANVAFALAAVRALSIPVYHVLKRLTPVLVLIAKYFIGDASPPLQVVLSVLTVVAGCIMAGFGDVTFDGWGYMWALVSCLLQTSYLLLVERSGTDKGYTSNELLLYNAVLSLPVLAVITHVSGEASVAWPSLRHLPPGFLVLLVLSLLLGALLNYSLFLCTLSNSALTTTIVGTLRSIVGTVCGFFVLGGLKPTPLVVSGVFTNTVGGIWYTVIKYRQRHNRIHRPSSARGSGTPSKDHSQKLPLFRTG